jgi:CheY-like chemotaxis protein
MSVFSKVCVLHVEDDPNDVFLLDHAFKEIGVIYPVLAVSDGEGAVDYLKGKGRYRNRERFPLPAVVVMDVKLPGRSGIEVLEWLRNEEGLRGLQVIMLSTAYRPWEIERAYHLGIVGCFLKPCEPSERVAMARVIAGWLRFNQFPMAIQGQPLFSVA